MGQLTVRSHGRTLLFEEETLRVTVEAEGQEDYLLYALLNGGAAYMDRDGAYPNCDGAFESDQETRLDEEIARYRVVAQLQERVARCEMVRHRFLDRDLMRQQTVFSDGTTVTVNFHDNSYRLELA